MKKSIITILSIFLLFFTMGIQSYAKNEEVNIDSVKIYASSVSVSGTTDATAVTIQIRKSSEIVSMDTVGTIDGKFSKNVSGSFTVGETYTVYVADYEGGSWATFEAVAVANPQTGNSGSNESDSSNNQTEETKTEEVKPTEIPAVKPATKPAVTPVEPSKTEEKSEEKESEKPEEEQSSEEKPETPVEGQTEEKTEPDVVIEAKLEGDSKEAWESIAETILESMTDEEGNALKAEVKVEMGETKEVPAELFEEIKGKDVDVVFEMDNGICWTVNGQDIGDIDFSAINLEVKLDKGDIPEKKIKQIADGKEVVNLSLTFDGEFGFKATLTVDMGSKNAGKYANLYYYNPETGEYEFVCAAPIDENGNADLGFGHASDYTIVIDTVAATVAKNATSATTSGVAVPGGFNWPILLIGIGVLLLAVIVSVILKSKKSEQ